MNDKFIYNRLVNLYLDIDPTTKRPFYVGIGVDSRIKNLKRNKFHNKIVESLPNNFFIRKVLYKNIPLEKAWRIEKQIIKKCGRLVYGTGFLANIHDGGALPMNGDDSHWIRGKKIKDVLPDYINPRTGKTYDEMYGEKKEDIIRRQVKKRMETRRKRMETIGKTQKELDFINKRRIRRKNKQYTENELESFKRQSLNQMGKKVKDRVKDPNWIDPRKGKTAKEIYGDGYKGPANKGKTYKELKGADYVLPTAKPFFIQIDNEQPIFCESESYFCKTFNCNDVLLRKLKKIKELGFKITRQLNSMHYFPNESIIKLFHANIIDNPKLEICIIEDIIKRQNKKIEEWLLIKNIKKSKRIIKQKITSNPFNIIINNNEPIYCISETDCCRKFKCDRTLLGMIKKLPNMTYHLKRKSGNAKHIFPENSIIKIEYV